MKRITRAAAALGLAAGFLLAVAPPASAGAPTFELTVTGEVRCLDTGEAEITWTAVASIVSTPDTTIEIVLPVGLRPQGVSLAGVRFEGVQSGAATGAVQFDPETQFVPASNDSFPVSSQAVAVVPGAGGTVTLDATVTIFNPNDPETFFEAIGDGSVELPTCEQPVVSASAAPAAETRPRFTG